MNRRISSLMPIFVFFSTYTIGNSILYLVFGNSYLETPDENQTLVFLTTWFSFAEKVRVPNTPLIQALYESMATWNFGIPAIVLATSSFVQYWKPQFLELYIKEYRFPHFDPCYAYGLSILSSYVVSLLHWQYEHLKPSTGVSIVAVCLLTTYTIVPLALFLREVVNKNLRNAVLPLIAFGVVVLGALWFAPGYEGNSLHLAGLILYAIFAFVLALVIFSRHHADKNKQDD